MRNQAPSRVQKIVIVRLNDGIDWNSMDGKPTSFIFSLLIPDGEAGTTHLKLLATVARMLMKADVKEALLGATTAEQLEEVLNSHFSRLTHSPGEKAQNSSLLVFLFHSPKFS